VGAASGLSSHWKPYELHRPRRVPGPGAGDGVARGAAGGV